MPKQAIKAATEQLLVAVQICISDLVLPSPKRPLWYLKIKLYVKKKKQQQQIKIKIVMCLSTDISAVKCKSTGSL